MHATDQQLRGALLISLLRRGVSEEAARVVTYAVHPFDSDVPPVSRGLERSIRKRIRRLTKSLRSASTGEVGPRAIATLRAHHADAVTYGDPVYRQRFSKLLDTFEGKSTPDTPALAPEDPLEDVPLAESGRRATRTWSPDSLYAAFEIPSPDEGRPNGPRADEIAVACCALLCAGFETIGLAEAGTADAIYEDQDKDYYRRDVQVRMSRDQNHDEVLAATILQLSIAPAVETAARAANRQPDADPALLVSWEALCWGIRTQLVACNRVDWSWKFKDQSLARTLIDEGFSWLAAMLPTDASLFLSPRVKGQELDYPDRVDPTYWPSWLAHRLACRASEEGVPLIDVDLNVVKETRDSGLLPPRLTELMRRAYQDDIDGSGMSADPSWWDLVRAGTTGEL